METTIGKDFLITAIKRLKYYKDLGEKAMEQLNDTECNYLTGEESNSVAMIVQHMYGNMKSRWTNFLTEDGEKPWRNRDSEFENLVQTKESVVTKWQEGWQCLLNTLESLQPADLVKTVHIRQEPLTVVDAINRQLAHYPYHVGQIVYVARMIKKDQWVNLSIPRGDSEKYNQSADLKDPAKRFQ